MQLPIYMTILGNLYQYSIHCDKTTKQTNTKRLQKTNIWAKSARKTKKDGRHFLGRHFVCFRADPRFLTLANLMHRSMASVVFTVSTRSWKESILVIF